MIEHSSRHSPNHWITWLRALQAISANQRMAVILHDYADLPNDEIARLMGVARATVYVHLSQGRKRLRRLLEEPDED
jgi:RNA polymerase sigma factor (sigma-70 family)